MAIVEVNMPSGFVPVETSLYELTSTNSEYGFISYFYVFQHNNIVTRKNVMNTKIDSAFF